VPLVRRLANAVVHGEWLRHRPVALSAADQRPVRAIARSAAGERDVSGIVFPVSLSPFVIGVARAPNESATEATELRMREASGEELGVIRLAPAGTVRHPTGQLDLFMPTGSAALCIRSAELAWRYAAAWRHMWVNAKRPGAFTMSFADLKALNVFYMMPRPVYLVTVMGMDRGNMFPMDLVGPLGSDRFLLALRATSQSIATIAGTRKIALSGAPARFKDIAYRLGGQHREHSLDWRSLELATVPSPLFGFPVAAEALGVRELEVRHSQVVGSHMLFVTDVARQSDGNEEPQLCHVSDMYARWRALRGRPIVDA
jgi:flavin reductase (DIM6/NTAB) family NADH-FMN oxidoreductase RutF